MLTLNWKLLTAFEAAARHRSFTRAASELNVQQPAISRRVAELEADLGIELLQRTRPHATLTREGEALYRAIAGRHPAGEQRRRTGSSPTGPQCRHGQHDHRFCELLSDETVALVSRGPIPKFRSN